MTSVNNTYYKHKTNFNISGTLKKAKVVKQTHHKKRSRKVYSYEKNLAPSVEYVKALSEGIRNHAEMRIQFFHATALSYFQMACQSDQSKLNINVWVGSASLQVGKGDRANHAAHPNAAAGIQDNFREEYVRDISLKAQLSPKKKRILESKLSKEAMDSLSKNLKDPKKVKKIILKHWKEGSIIGHTDFQLRLNATNKLPSGLNLGCDLPLEKRVRPLIGKLCSKLSVGKLKPREATAIFIKATMDHFKAQIRKHKKNLTILQNAGKKNYTAIQRCAKQIYYHKQELYGTIAPNYDLLEKDFLKPLTPTKQTPPELDLDKLFDIFD